MISLSEREHKWFHDFGDSVFVFILCIQQSTTIYNSNNGHTIIFKETILK